MLSLTRRKLVGKYCSFHKNNRKLAKVANPGGKMNLDSTGSVFVTARNGSGTAIVQNCLTSDSIWISPIEEYRLKRRKGRALLLSIDLQLSITCFATI